LKLLNQFFHLNIPDQHLAELALTLGSDCPFFIYNQPAFATGRGEIMEPTTLDLSGYSIVLINPGIHISTAQAFAGIQPKTAEISLREAILQPIATWKNTIGNDFESTVFPLFPVLSGIKSALYQQGALYASLTGTGSTVYGIFPNTGKPEFNFPQDWSAHYLH
jgi:4-diphosphocytidyl-2-C-methyl-D-erythritol kinase